MNETENYRIKIAHKVRALRQGRRWPQKELARLIGLSQSRLSEIEGGNGSFTAEQMIVLSKTFNVPLSEFVPGSGSAGQELQNALARLGATHLFENQDVLPGKRLEQAGDVIYETLAAPGTARQITALAPVLVNHATRPLLNRCRVRFSEAGLRNRFGWLLANVREALSHELKKALPPEWKKKYTRAQWTLEGLLETPTSANDQEGEDVLDDTIVHPKTLAEVRESSSGISRAWRLVTRIQPADFAEALEAAHETR